MITISVSAVAISLYCLYKINKIESNIGLIYNNLSKLETQKTESNNACPINYSKNVVKSNISQSFKSNSLSNKEKEINDLKKEINEMEDIVYDSGSDGNTDESVEELGNMSDNLNEEHEKDSDSNSVKESLKNLDKKITENIENNILSQKSEDDKSADDKSADETNNYEIKENNIILDNDDKNINKELVQLINENTNNQTIDLNNYRI